jgi:hypothetical protein
MNDGTTWYVSWPPLRQIRFWLLSSAWPINFQSQNLCYKVVRIKIDIYVLITSTGSMPLLVNY